MNPFIKGTITLCGSGRYLEQFNDASTRLELNGWKVFSISKNIKSSDLKLEVSEDLKNNLDELHKSKILDSVAIMVIDVDNYIGASTKGEIDYAWHLGLKIFSYSLTLRMHPAFDALVYANLHNYPDWSGNEVLETPPLSSQSYKRSVVDRINCIRCNAPAKYVDENMGVGYCEEHHDQAIKTTELADRIYLETEKRQKMLSGEKS